MISTSTSCKKMDKSSLRKSYLSARKSLTPLEIQSKNHLISQRLIHFVPWQKLKLIHLYLPMLDNKEIDTLPVIQTIRNNFKKLLIAVPKVKDDNQLEHYLLAEHTRLQTNKWGIPEPVDATPVRVEQIDLVIAPMIIFDKTGHRIGYGKGYYDRFLAQCRKDTPKIALCYFDPVDRIAPEPTDVAMDAVITPEGVWTFS